MSIFNRLKEERKRLGHNQPDFGELGGVKKLAQINYEKGERKPDSAYLARIASAGADVQYIITGIRSDNLALIHDPKNPAADTERLRTEQTLIKRYRKAPQALKEAALRFLGED